MLKESMWNACREPPTPNEPPNDAAMAGPTRKSATLADPNGPAPRVSVWEDRMHPWVGLPDGIEHIG